MGNRAVITTEYGFVHNGIGIYLHWNGGRASVEAFLKYCELRGFRSPDKDCYGWARLAQVIGNFFGGGLSVGIDKVQNLDCKNHDNGVYLIRDWKIVGRRYFSGPEQNDYDLKEMVISIDKAQPESEQIGSDFFNATVMKREDLAVGMRVFVRHPYSEKYETCTVVGFGKDMMVNGTNVKGLPRVNLYDSDACPGERNINNYLQEDEYPVVVYETAEVLE